jgi:medium-chain acyl-[acyl-carrier-protein] hydrolase
MRFDDGCLVSTVNLLPNIVDSRAMRSVEHDPWVVRRPCNAPLRLRLFCFPYAGGGTQIYRSWAGTLPGDIEVCAVQLPGRERRHAEPPIRSIAYATDALSAALRPYLDLPFALFGHSMGAVLAYEIARRFLTETGCEPYHLFVSGHRAPHLTMRKKPLHRLPDDDFLTGMKALNGTPAEVFEYPELIELFLPMLRADFELVETYGELDGPRLSCPVTAMGGDADPDVPPEDIAAWRGVTKGPFRSLLFKGDHFFVNTARVPLLKALRQALTPVPLSNQLEDVPVTGMMSQSRST